jgi:dienelactone hydrolase
MTSSMDRRPNAKPRSHFRRFLRAFAALAALGVVGIAALLGAMWVERNSGVALPLPAGPFAVGRVVFDWTDRAALDALAPVPGARRELLAWIWYPAEGPPHEESRYLPAAVAAAVEASRPAIFTPMSRNLARVRAHSLADAPVTAGQGAYPVLILRGGASLETWNYASLAEDLASHGYIVAGIDAPYRTNVVVFPDGRTMRRTPDNNPELCEGRTDEERCIDRIESAWTSDIGFALDRLAQLNASDPSGRFTGKLDLARAGVFGHSFGGAQAAQFCARDARCRAGIDVDGALHGSVIEEGIHKPFLFLLSGQGDFSSGAEVRRIKADIQSVYERLPANGRLRVSIRGANHFLFSDDAVLRSHILMRSLRVLGIVQIDGARQLAVTAFCLRSFFDAYLKGPGDAPPALTSPLYPEIEALN